MCVCVSPRLLQARGLGGFCRLSGCGCGGVCVCVCVCVLEASAGSPGVCGVCV